MDDRTPEFGKPSEQTGSAHASNNTAATGARAGGAIAGVGCLIAIAPLVITPFYCGLRGNPGGCGDVVMTVFMTVPLGGVVAIIGLIAAMVGGSTQTVTDDAGNEETEPVSKATVNTAGSENDTAYPADIVHDKPAFNPSKIFVSQTIAIRLWILNLVASGLVLASSALNLWDTARATASWSRHEQIIDWPSTITFFTATPLVISAWLLFLAYKVKMTAETPEARTRYVRLASVQTFAGVASAFGLFGALSLMPGWVQGPLGALSVISGMTPVSVGLIAWFVTAATKGRVIEDGLSGKSRA